MATTQTDRIGGILSSVAIKAPCQAAATIPITLSGLQMIDGYTTLQGDRILVTGQVDETTNGIYIASATAWLRDVDWNGNRDVAQGTLVLVNEGSNYSGVFFQVESASPIVVGTTAITFSIVNLATNFVATSNSSVVIGTGTKVFAISQATAFAPGQFVIASSTVSPTNYISGQIVSFADGILTINATSDSGSGTFASWIIAISGAAGPQGATGATGAQGASGSIPIGTGGGTVNAITMTAGLTSLADKTLVACVFPGANTSTTPTLNSDSLGAKTITARGGQALLAGDIPGALAVGILEYNLAHTRWELLNPAVTSVPVTTGTIQSNISGGTAAPGPSTLTAILDALIGTTRGGVLVRGVSQWAIQDIHLASKGVVGNGADAVPATVSLPGQGVSQFVNDVGYITSAPAPSYGGLGWSHVYQNQGSFSSYTQGATYASPLGYAGTWTCSASEQIGSIICMGITIALIFLYSFVRTA